MSAVDGMLRADTVVALMARQIDDGAVVATGVASPLAILAIAVARATHAPNLTYLACVGSWIRISRISIAPPRSSRISRGAGRRSPFQISSITRGAVESTPSSSAPPRWIGEATPT